MKKHEGERMAQAAFSGKLPSRKPKNIDMCQREYLSPTTGGKLEPIRALPKHYGMRGGQTGFVPVGAPNHGLELTANSLVSL
jgi:hypothetical protein